MRGIANPLTTGPFSATIPDTAGMVGIPSGASGGSLSNDLLPWLINVDVFMTAASHVNWDTNQANSVGVYNFFHRSSGAQNDEITFNVVLAAGTWTFELIYRKDANTGIFTVSFDGVSKGTIDSYDPGGGEVGRTQITGIAVSGAGKVALNLKMATKNASSGGYYGQIYHMQLKRTA